MKFQVGEEVYFYERPTGVIWKLFPSVHRLLAKIIGVRDGEYDLELLGEKDVVVGGVPYWKGKLNLEPGANGYAEEPKGPAQWFGPRDNNGTV